MPHSDEIPAPVFEQLPSLEDEDDILEDNLESVSDEDFVDVPTTEPKRFDQPE